MSSHSRRGTFVALLLVTFATLPAAGQEKLAEGTWTGTVMPPDEGIVDVEYLVAYGEDGLEIELVPPAEMGMGSFTAFDVLFDGEALSFTLDVGEIVSCALVSMEDGHLEGECVDSSGFPASMTMFPPHGTR